MLTIRRVLIGVVLVLSVIVSGMSHPASAQSPNDGFDPDANGTVRSVTTDYNGNILIGGDFTTIGGITRNRIVRIGPNAILDASFNPNVNNSVYAIKADAYGKLLIGGAFTTISGVYTRNRIARLNSNGSIDTSFNVNADNTVYAIALQSDNKILVGGAFSFIGSPFNGIARLNSDGTPDNLNFRVGNGANFTVTTIAVQPDGKIVIGGAFTTFDSVARTYIARLNSDGSLDTSFNINVDDKINSVAIQPDGKIVIGGDFTTVGGEMRNRIARLNSDGTLDTSFDPDANATVFSALVQPDGKVIISGSFTNIGGTTRNAVARLLENGALDTTFINPSVGDPVYAIWHQTDGKIIIGGDFITVGGITRNRIARLYPSGRLDRTANISADNYVSAIAVQPDGKFILGGGFTNISSTAKYSRRLVRVNEDGVIDESFNFTTDFAGEIYSAVVLPDGKIVIGGSFVFGGISRNNIARLSSDGTLDNDFAADVNGTVNAIAVQPNGNIIIGGLFTTVGGTTRNNIARVSSTGSLDTDFDPNVNSAVKSIAIQQDGKILIGGEFETVGGVSQRYIARLNRDGILDPGFFNCNPDRKVYSIALQPDGKILIGGDFTTLLNGASYPYIARLLSFGIPDLMFNSFTNGTVYSLAVQSDGKIIVGGDFTTIYGFSCNRIGRLYASGDFDSSFNPEANGTVYSVAVSSDGKILVGGTFTTINGIDRNRFARLTNTYPAIQEVKAMTSGSLGDVTLQWALSGTGPEFSRVWFERLTDGTTWTALGEGSKDVLNWQITGIAMQVDTPIYVRARGMAQSGLYSASGSLFESVKLFYFSGYKELTISKNGTGTGTVTSVPAGINCGTECSVDCAVGTTFLLTATPSGNSAFTGWTGGGCDGGIGECFVTVNENTTVTATFDRKYTLSVVKNGTGANAGIVTSTPAVISCGDDCSELINSGTSVTLHASANDEMDTMNVRFAGWSGSGCSGTGDCVVTVNADTTVEAEFVRVIEINSGSNVTKSTAAVLTLDNPTAVRMHFMVNNTTWTAWEGYSATKKVTLPAGDGLKFVAVQFNNDPNIYIDFVILDTKAPVGTVQIAGGATVTDSRDVTLSITAADPADVAEMCVSATTICTAWESFSATRAFTLAGTAYGTKYVYVKFKDLAGNISVPVSDTIMYVATDNLPPAYANYSAIVINDGKTYTKTTAIELTTIRNPLPGMYTQMQFSTNGTIWTAWEAIKATRVYALSAGDGIKSVFVRFKTAAGLQSGVYGDDIILDTKPPAGTVVIKDGLPFTEETDVMVRFFITDTNGVAEMQYSFDSVSWSLWEEPYVPEKTMTLQGTDGMKKISFKFKDNAGNISAVISDTILLDRTPPVGKVVINGGAAETINTLVTLTLTAPTALNMRISVDNGTTWGEDELFAPTKQVFLPGGEGSKTVSVIFSDLIGNESEPVTDTIFLKVPPDYINDDTTIVIENHAAYATKTAVAVAINNPDPVKYTHMRFATSDTAITAWETVKEEKTVYLPTGDGIKFVLAKFKTAAGAESGFYGDTIILDTKAPVGAIVINSGAVSTNDVNVSVQIEATDMNGVSKMQVSTDGVTWPLSWEEDYATSRAITLTGLDGTKKIAFKFKDSAGNISAVVYDTILLDRIKPIGKVVINAGAAETMSDTVTLTLSAPTAVSMQIDYGFGWGSWEPYVTSKKVTLPSGAGTKTVAVIFKDFADNESIVATDTITRLSYTAANISINNDYQYTNTTTVKLKIINPDPFNYTFMKFSTNGTTWSAWEAFKEEKTITLPVGDGIKFVYVKFKNAAGSETGIYGDDIILDTRVPVGSISINYGAAATNDVNVTVVMAVTDPSNINKMKYSLDGIFWTEWESYAETKAVKLTGPDGMKKVSFKFMDYADKESAILYDTIILDRAAPVGAVVINAGAEETTSDTVTLALSAPTAFTMQISLDGGSTWGSWEPYVTSKIVTLTGGVGENIVAVKFKDYPGNESTIATDSINLQ